LSKASFGYHLKKNSLYIIEINSEPAGYILWLKRKKYFRLYSLAVSKRFQKQGIAQKLLAYSFEHLKEKSFSLEVKISNEGAIRLYEKFGFRIKRVLSNYYEKEDGYWMVLKR
jgi:[ribosomal protein S18]-alanine N-acetyltransferase